MIEVIVINFTSIQRQGQYIFSQYQIKLYEERKKSYEERRHLKV